MAVYGIFFEKLAACFCTVCVQSGKPDSEHFCVFGEVFACVSNFSGIVLPKPEAR